MSYKRRGNEPRRRRESQVRRRESEVRRRSQYDLPGMLAKALAYDEVFRAAFDQYGLTEEKATALVGKAFTQLVEREGHGFDDFFAVLKYAALKKRGISTDTFRTWIRKEELCDAHRIGKN